MTHFVFFHYIYTRISTIKWKLVRIAKYFTSKKSLVSITTKYRCHEFPGLFDILSIRGGESHSSCSSQQLLSYVSSLPLLSYLWHPALQKPRWGNLPCTAAWCTSPGWWAPLWPLGSVQHTARRDQNLGTHTSIHRAGCSSRSLWNLGGLGVQYRSPPVGAHLPQAVTDSRDSGRQGTAEGILWPPGAAPQHHCSQPGSKANVFERRQREMRNETYSTNREGTCHWGKANTEAQGGCSSAAPSPRSWRVTGALPMGNRSVQAGRGRGERKNKQTNK